MAANALYYGDNLEILRRYVAGESVDLVYLDPPFNSNASYNVLFAERSGEQAASQIRAFEDTWTWSLEAELALEAMIAEGGQVSLAMQAFRKLLGTSNMMAYLAMMAPRLVELRRVLKPTGSLYLHCDPTASHYLKILLDAVFGGDRFLNEIIWHYQTSGGAPKKTLIRDHDTIFRYSKGPQKGVTWNAPRNPWPESTLKKWQRDEQGRIYHIHNDTGRRYYIDPEGKLADDVWDITLAARSSERLGYPTQKPLQLLERIIGASSNPGDTVLDPFCGCGTTIDAAEKLGRRWIGIDVTYLAIALIRRRLRDAHGEDVDRSYEVIGEPASVADAGVLAEADPYQFQWWALDQVHARGAEQKKGADKGVDGRIYFHEGDSSGVKQIVISVKAGKPHLHYVRDLRGVMDREGAAIGVLIGMQEPTGPMKEEAASAGLYTSPWGKHPRLQLLTVEDLLGGKGIDCPPLRHTSQTFKRAPKASVEASAASLFDGD